MSLFALTCALVAASLIALGYIISTDAAARRQCQHGKPHNGETEGNAPVDDEKKV